VKIHPFAPCALLSLVLVACGGTSASTSPSVAPSAAAPTPAATPAAATPAPSTAASTAPSGSPATVNVPHGAPELEAKLPTTFRGTDLFTVSFGPADLAASPAAASFQQIMTQSGGDMAKAAFAVANDTASGASGTFNVFAINGGGADGDKLLTAYVDSAVASGQSLSSTKTTLGGKDTVRIKSPDSNPLGDAWVYAADDILYGVQSKDESVAAEIIGLLP
jgi:hypothetical protein